MGVLHRAIGSLLVGVLCFVIVGAAITVWLVRWIELSLMLGIPMGLTAGLTGLFATYAVLEYRAMHATGPVASPVSRRLWAAVGATVAYGLTTVVGFALFFYGNGDDGVWVLLFGLPLAVGAGAVIAYVAARVLHDGGSHAPAPPQRSG